jgi:predicted O-methyltransferase YrrM
MMRESFLKRLKEYGVTNDIPNISEETADILGFLIRLLKPQNVLEIGSANAYSTIQIANVLESYGGKMLSCDISKHSYLEAKKNIQEVGLQDVIDLQFGDALDLLKTCEQKFDFVFLDARKSYYHLFWNLIKPLMNQGALVVVDDVLKFPQKTEPFHKALEQDSDYLQWIIPVDSDDGIMLIQKK